MKTVFKKNHIMGIWMLAAVCVFGLFILLAVGKLKSYDRTVEVRGLCEREYPADHANYPLTYKVAGDDLVTLYNEVNKKNQVIVNFLKENGFEDSDINITTPKVTDYEMSDYYTKHTHRYVMSSTVNIYTDKVDNVVALQTKLSKLIEMGIAISSGDGWSNPISFEFTALNDIKPEMIDEAIVNAHTAGEQFAKNSKSKLGKIKTASQGLFSIEDRDAQTPNIKRIRVVTYVTYYLD